MCFHPPIKMHINFHIVSTKSKGTNVVITIILWKTTHTQKTMGGNYASNEVSWWNGKGDKLKYMYNTHLTASLLLDSCSQDLFLWIPFLSLDFWEKQVSQLPTSIAEYIWPENNHIQDLFDIQTKIEDYCIEQLKCLNLKLHEQECIKKENLEKKIIFQELMSRSRLLDAKRF